MVLWLYWNMMFLTTVYPTPQIKYSVHETGTIILLTSMILLYVELHLLIFCFHETLVMDPDPREIMKSLCTRQQLCVENDASTHQFITERLSSLRVIQNPNVPLIYFITRFSFPQSLSSGAFTIVVRKSTAIFKSQRTHTISNKSFTTT